MKNFYTISGYKFEIVKPTGEFDIRFVPQKELASHGEVGQQEIARLQAIIEQRAA